MDELIKPEGLPSQGAVSSSQAPSQSMTRNQDINPADKLEQLDTLKKRGLITRKDYDVKRAEILKNL